MEPREQSVGGEGAPGRPCSPPIVIPVPHTVLGCLRAPSPRPTASRSVGAGVSWFLGTRATDGGSGSRLGQGAGPATGIRCPSGALGRALKGAGTRPQGLGGAVPRTDHTDCHRVVSSVPRGPIPGPGVGRARTAT